MVSGPCCTPPPSEYRRFFNRRVARIWLRRYRRRGLPGTARGLIERAGDVGGASVLEVGGGLGTLGIELLEAGADRGTNVELSAGFEEAAAELLAERGLGGRVDRRIADFVLAADEIPAHDVVLLHRVVCCYPDVDALVGAASARTGRTLLLTYPRVRLLTRAGFRGANVWLRLRRCGFRTYLHPFVAIASAAEREGLTLTVREAQGFVWENAAFARLGDAADGNGDAMEPRHRETEADERSAEREVDATEEPRERRGQEDVRVQQDDDAAPYRTSLDEETQI